MQTEVSRRDQSSSYNNIINYTCNDVSSDSPKKIHKVLTKINSNQSQLNNLLYKLSKPKNITVNNFNQLHKIYRNHIPENEKKIQVEDTNIIYIMKQLKNKEKRRSLKLPIVDTVSDFSKMKLTELLKSNIKTEDTYKKKRQIIYTKGETTPTEHLSQVLPQNISRTFILENPKNLKSKLHNSNNSSPITGNSDNNYQIFKNNKNINGLQISYDSNQNRSQVPDYPKKQYLRNELERIQEKQEERLTQTSNNKNRIIKPSKNQINSVQKTANTLLQINQQQIQKYIENNGQLSINLSVDQIYDYFLDLAKTLKIMFQNPLIKRYKNCIYFGDNFSQIANKDLCQGFLYHYQQKIYYGEFKSGKRHGNGCEINFKQNIISKGQFYSGYKRGSFHILKKNDYEYTGEVFDGLFQGHGILITNQSKYEGQFIKGLKQGKGKQFFYKTEQTYTGCYQEGKFQNQGQLISKDYFYEGNFQNGLQDGQGYEKTLTQQYKGRFSKGKREGNGLLYLNNGDTYTGQFKSGNMHGKGQLKLSNGKILNGYFNKGILQEQKQSRHSTPNNNITNITMNSSLLKKSRDLKYILQDEQIYDDKKGNSNIDIKNDSRLISYNINRSSKINPEILNSRQKIIRNFKNEDIRVSSSFNPEWQTSGEFNQKSRYNSTERNQLILNASTDFKNLFNSNFMSNKQQRQKIPIKFDFSMLESSVDDEIPSFPVIQKGLQKRFGNKN